jgi:lysophospholipase L1-like esterase
MSRLRAIAALFTCLVSAAGMAATPIQPKVVFYGDSTTYDWKLPQNSNAFQVNRNWNNQAFNSPATSTEMLARFNADVVSFHPTVVHITGGYFDILNVCKVDCASAAGQKALTVAITNIENNIRVMVTLAQKNGIKVVLGAIPPFTAALAPLNSPVAYRVYDYNNSWLKPYATTQHIPVVDYNAILGYYLSPNCDQYAAPGGCGEGQVASPPWYTTDGINPNALGYAIMTPFTLIAVDIADVALQSGYLGTANNVNVISLSQEKQSNQGLVFYAYGMFSDGVVRKLDPLYLMYGGNQNWKVSDPKVLAVNPLYGGVMATGLGTARVSVTVNGHTFSPWQITVVP